MNELLIKKNNGDYEAAESFNKLKIIWLPGCSAAKIVVHESVLIRGSLAIAIHNNSKIVIENNCILRVPIIFQRLKIAKYISDDQR